MPINFRMREEDALYIAFEQTAQGTPLYDLETERQKLEAWLDKIGVRNAVVDNLRHNGKVVFGQSRVPYIVCSDSDVFIMKECAYRLAPNFNSKHEPEILRYLDGEFTPEILEANTEFIAERFVKGQVPLCELIDEENLVREGARITAELAKHGINYHHEKWHDDFALLPDGRQIVTDFGSARWFSRPQDMAHDIGALEQVETPYNFLVISGQFFPLLVPGDNQHDETLEKVTSLSDDPATLLNLFSVLKYSFEGIHTYSAQNTIDPEDYKSARDRKTKRLIPVFVDEFYKAYRA